VDNEAVFEMRRFIDIWLWVDDTLWVGSAFSNRFSIRTDVFGQLGFHLGFRPGGRVMEVCIAEKAVEEGDFGADDFEFFLGVSLFFHVVKERE
jgi:hypothetical protein